MAYVVFMEQWPSGYGAGFPNQGSHVQNDTAVHPSEVNKMSTRDFWKLSGKK